jgi:phosphoglycerate dehydrogenase-like enzyme
VSRATWRVLSTSPSFGRHSDAPVDLLRDAGCEVVLAPRLAEPDLIAELAHADAWIAGFEPVAAGTVGAASRLRVVAKCGAGMDNFDLAYLAERGIRAVNVPGGNAGAVAEYAVGLLIALARGIVATDATVRSGGWGPVVGTGLAGRTLGIVGLGRIGGRVAELGRALGMQVLAHDPGLADREIRLRGVVPAALPDLLAAADVVSLHVPLTAATRGLIGEPELGLLGPEGLLVSCSRGGVVDEVALCAALGDGTVRAAALDVFENEPLPADSPLRDAPRLLLSSHTAGYSDRALADVTWQCARNVLDVLEAS